MSIDIRNFISGKWVEAQSGKRRENRNPADTDDLVGTFPDSGPEDLDAAVQAAREAFDAWRLTPPPKRGQILLNASRMLVERKEETARVMTRENGKILLETRGDVQEAIDTGELVHAEGRRLFGDTTTSELPDKFCMSVRRPIGVCGMITAWNFPVAVPSWKIFPALLCGNTIVFKPSEETPHSAKIFVEVLAEAGVPGGVLNMVCGDGANVGAPMVRHPGVDVIAFTGSCDVGRDIARAGGETLKRVSLELGGKNGQIVMDDADLDLALEGALWGAFGTTGQRCTATSRVILHEAVHDEFVDALVKRAEKIKIGNGLDETVQMGPLITAKQRDRVHEYVEIGRKEGASVRCGGRFAAGGDLDKGFFYQPTVFADVKPDMRIATEEIFGPVLSVLKIRSLDEAIQVHNGTDYGLSSSIYTKDVNAAFRAMRDIDAGITYINGPTIGAEVHLPFGGVKNTGNGHREAGTQVYDIFTEWKSVYVDYSGRLQRAQIDTE